MTTNKNGAGRRLTKEYFSEFDNLKSIGSFLQMEIDPNRVPIKIFRLKILNQARSYSKAETERSKFKVSTRIIGNNLTVTRVQ